MSTLKSGYVAVIGRPNSGKSTLINQVLGEELSIVSPKAQTTRERVLGIFTDPKGQMIFVDTPGIHKAKTETVNAYMLQEANASLSENPDVIWYLVDPRSTLKHEEVVLESLTKIKDKETISLFLLENKIDLTRIRKTLEMDLLKEKVTALGFKKFQSLNLSGLRQLGTDSLLELTWADLPEGPLYYEDTESISDKPTRFFVAEKIREQLFKQLGEEIPYSCAVEITKYQDEEALTRIEANVLVERESQKPIVIGKSAQKIKEIGTASRENIEKFIGRKVFLGLRVKVNTDWTRDKEKLKKLGYRLQA